MPFSSCAAEWTPNHRVPPHTLWDGFRRLAFTAGIVLAARVAGDPGWDLRTTVSESSSLSRLVPVSVVESGRARGLCQNRRIRTHGSAGSA